MTIDTQKRKKLYKNIILVLAILVFIISIMQFRNQNNTKTISIDGLNIEAYVAESIDERKKGLSIFDSLEENESMLFVFDNNSYYSFWMKDMKFSIDIVWLNENKEIVFIKENAQPKDFPEKYTPNQKSLYVLEFQSGFVENNNLNIGDQFNWK